MSTRATYQFKQEGKPTVIIYKHHDGYPVGAADHLKCAVGSSNPAEAFLRAHDEAEITESHEIHGDTEYRYNVINQQVEVYERNYDSGNWAKVLECELEQFVEGAVSREAFETLGRISEIEKQIQALKEEAARLLA